MAVPDNTPATGQDAAPTPAVTRTARQAPQQQTLALLPPAAAAFPAPLPRAAKTAPLWFALYFPCLPLEAAGQADASPARAVFDDQQGVRRVLQASEAARAAGVQAGQSVNAALALLPALELDARDPGREHQLLRRLAGWAEHYTSCVVIEPPAILLLEIAASLRLFGGLRSLCKQVLHGLSAQGVTAQPAIAPTPLAATWLARAGSRRSVVKREELPGALSVLPLDCLAWPGTVTASLAGMGITTVGDCLRLPRDGVTRRFGASRLLQLDRALGRLPDPRQSYRAPERFTAESELDEEQEDCERLLSACEPLLERLDAFLLTRQQALQRVRFYFFHLRAASTKLTLGSVAASRDTSHWLGLLRLRLEQLELPAPVIAIRLRGGPTQALEAGDAAFDFDGHPQGARHASITHLVERLAARIGEQAVYGVDTAAEHRPEYAYRLRRALDAAPQCSAVPSPWHERHAPQLLADLRRTSSLLLQRPLWMLDAPAPLACRDGQPCYNGVLSLKAGPERIETGWWDADGVARDYYVAQNPSGMHLWIYRHRGAAGGWYLHGIFG
ncbi:MAG: DNA polymerase Y family protein [Woeseia sp.]